MSQEIEVTPYKGYTIHKMAFEDAPNEFEYWVQNGCRIVGDAVDEQDACELIEALVEEDDAFYGGAFKPQDTPSLPEPWWYTQ